MKFGGQGPTDFGHFNQAVGPGQMGQGMPGYGPGPYGPGPSPGGSIRNTLGSGLKSSGVFQKDGQINNLRGGFIGPKRPPAMLGDPNAQYQAGYPQAGGVGYNQGAMPGPGAWGGNQGTGGGTGPFSFLGSGSGAAPGQPRQLILQGAQPGIPGNGIATISPDNSFMLVANLPPPANFSSGQGASSYAAYLVDKKGRTGFLAGILRPVGNGVYQTQFRSPVPLHHYERVVVSVETPGRLEQAPKGPIVLKVQEPMGPSALINPVKNAGGSIWRKITGLFRRTPKTPALPEGAAELPLGAEAVILPESGSALGAGAVSAPGAGSFTAGPVPSGGPPASPPSP